MSSTATFAAGVLGSLTADTILHPVDNLKCRHQTGQKGAPVHFRSLYRGYLAVVVAGAPGNGMFFLAYESSQQMADKLGITGDGKFLSASVIATVVSTSVYCPMEVVKETAFAHRISSLEAVRRVRAERGLIPGLFRGWTMGVATWVPYLSIYYVLYERFRAQWAPFAAGESVSSSSGSGEAAGSGSSYASSAAAASSSSSSSSASSSSSSSSPSSDAASPALPTTSGGLAFAVDLAAGLSAATIAASVTYPLDTLKTRLQSGVVSLGDRRIWQLFSTEKGLMSLRGLVLRILWLAPGSALNVSLYERYASVLGGLGA